MPKGRIIGNPQLESDHIDVGHYSKQATCSDQLRRYDGSADAQTNGKWYNRMSENC